MKENELKLQLPYPHILFKEQSYAAKQICHKTSCNRIAHNPNLQLPICMFLRYFELLDKPFYADDKFMCYNNCAIRSVK
jgi:hypothetical protein